MAVSKNLTHKLTVEEARKGGKNSVKSRHNKKLIKDCLDTLLEKTIEDENGEKMSGAEALAVKAFREALSGNSKFWELIRDTVGQKPVERVMVSEVDPDVIREVEEMVNGVDESASG